MTQLNNLELWTIPELDSIVECEFFGNQSDGIYGLAGNGTSRILKRETGGVIKGAVNITLTGETFVTIRYTKTTDVIE